MISTSIKPMDWADWHGPVEIGHPAILELPDSPAALALCTTVPIPRAIGADAGGVLFIGRAKGIMRSMRSVRQWFDARAKEDPHGKGWRAAFAFLHAHGLLPEVRVRWRLAEDLTASYTYSGEIMAQYMDRFHELPPLNYRFNWTSLPDAPRARFASMIEWPP